MGQNLLTLERVSKGMIRVFKSFGYALKGLRFAIKTQLNFRLQLAAAVLVSALGWYLGLSPVEWAVILICIALVLSLELLNTALEVLVDLVSPQWHVKAGIIKDVAAAAVLWSALLTLIVAFVIFVPKFLS